MNELDRNMAILAAEHGAARAPLGVERAVLAEFDASRRRARWRIGAASAAIAAVLIVGALVAGVFVSRERPPRMTEAAAANIPQSGAAAVFSRQESAPVMKTKPPKRSLARHKDIAPESTGEPFVAIPYTVPLAPEERATVVRITLSPSAIAAVGFPLPAIDPGMDTIADVLVGEDGRAHAIRLVTDSDFR